LEQRTQIAGVPIMRGFDPFASMAAANMEGEREWYGRFERQ
jgi:hypothetical protein